METKKKSTESKATPLFPDTRVAEAGGWQVEAWAHTVSSRLAWATSETLTQN